MNNKEQVQKCLADIYEQCTMGRQTNVTSDAHYCAAKYENVWYRASIIVNNQKSPTLDVNYVDFGNSEVLPEKTPKPYICLFLKSLFRSFSVS